MATTEQRRARSNLTTARKRRIRERQAYQCARCQKPVPRNKFGECPGLEIHHRKRVADCGTNEDANLWALCKDCHEKEHRSQAIIAGIRVMVYEGATGLRKLEKWKQGRFESDERHPVEAQDLEGPGVGQESPGPGPHTEVGTMATMTGNRPQQGDSDIREIKERDLEWNTSTGEPHPAGMCELALVKIQPFEDEGGVQRIRMTFESDEVQENGEPWPVSCKTKPSFHPRSNVAKFLVACGEDLKQVSAEGRNFKLSSYVRGNSKHKKVMGSIIHEPRPDGQGVYARIESFAPVKVKAQKPTRTEEAEPEVVPAADERKRRVLTEDDEDE